MIKGKKGQSRGLITPLVVGMGALIVSIILIFVFINTITDANLLTDNTASDNATDRLTANFTSGIDEVSSKVPTILKIAAVVLLFGILMLLWDTYKRMNLAGSGGSAL